ncbi:AAA family ATPase [Vagococcus hydrophili]|uniref:Kinase n=1 Tax=Vagococcus hydrophili TaxID=2714947 RepID=A0A6G8AUK3_9ENTE|nr:AAA family ATPase [Vagococcus hydrophili]QIL48748.1 kinase [Vagococcus hydrophili]
MSKVILIRGNSGSGKTTVANELHQIFGSGNLLISQDYVRRTMLNVKDKPMNLSVGLIETMIHYGIEHCEYTIIEGILANNKYGEMLRNSLNKADEVYAYYYDLSYEETTKRHDTKKETDFNHSQMKDWFVPHDFIGIENEVILSDEISKKDALKLILNDLNL